VEQVTYKKLDLNIWDIGGQTRLRPLWRHYFRGSDALIFVIDASDRSRIEEATNELHSLLKEDELRETHILVYANKVDLPHSLRAPELSRYLDLDKAMGIWKRPWYIQTSCAVTGEGLYEGLDWLDRSLSKRKSLIRSGGAM
jgi:ADP-ribosylation factor protein 1